MNDHEQDKKSASTDSKEVDKNEPRDDDKKLAKTEKEGEPKIDESKSDEFSDLSALELTADQNKKIVINSKNGELEKEAGFNENIDSSTLELDTEVAFGDEADSDLCMCKINDVRRY